ncbi:glycosyltransferase family 2 protein [Vogesella sp. GCM10023246]|uniref:Glycosyltransferase family 2 protein n=1 Tax=Vogesella oryzagri TaxID=3160864 RepID=A0ABV1M846_9NEIS
MQCTAILVTYLPDAYQLKLTIDSLTKNKLEIVIIDNTPIKKINNTSYQLHSSTSGINYICLEENYGIAKAQNIGIQLALKNHTDYILLSDQDTVYPSNFFLEMLSELKELQARGEKVAAIGPAYYDENKPDTPPSFVKYKNGELHQISLKSGAIEVSQLIASGTLIPTEAINQVGLMNPDLFIDWVDMEWCWRAINAGFSIYGTFNVTINHQLGDCSRKIGKKIVTIHSPFRNYFIVRNGLHLALRGVLLDKIQHQRHLIKKVLLYFFGMALLSDNKITDIKMMTRGITDAIRGRLGPLQ